MITQQIRPLTRYRNSSSRHPFINNPEELQMTVIHKIKELLEDGQPREVITFTSENSFNKLGECESQL